MLSPVTNFRDLIMDMPRLLIYRQVIAVLVFLYVFLIEPPVLDYHVDQVRPVRPPIVIPVFDLDDLVDG